MDYVSENGIIAREEKENRASVYLAYDVAFAAMKNKQKKENKNGKEKKDA